MEKSKTPDFQQYNFISKRNYIIKFLLNITRAYRGSGFCGSKTKCNLSADYRMITRYKTARDIYLPIVRQSFMTRSTSIQHLRYLFKNSTISHPSLAPISLRIRVTLYRCQNFCQKCDTVPLVADILYGRPPSEKKCEVFT